MPSQKGSLYVETDPHDPAVWSPPFSLWFKGKLNENRKPVGSKFLLRTYTEGQPCKTELVVGQSGDGTSPCHD